MTQHLWLPGQWPSVNQVLDYVRASGFYQGVAKGRGRTPGRRDAFAALVRGYRMRAKMEGKKQLQPIHGTARLAFYLVGHRRFDPGLSWSLSAKWVEDGLVDSEIIASDRFNVHAASGRTTQNRDEEKALFEERGLTYSGQPGLLVEVVGEV